MSGLVGLDSVGSLAASQLRAASAGTALRAADLASRLLATQEPVKATGGTPTDAAAVPATLADITSLLDAQHEITVQSLASPAEALSAGFQEGDVVNDGTLTLSVNGATFTIPLAGGLNDVVAAVQASGAPIDAGTISDGSQEFLTLQTREPGFPIGGVPSDALSVSEIDTGTTGKSLDVQVVKQASNAEITVDSQSFVRQSNIITDVLPGATVRVEGLTSSQSAPFVNQPFSAGLAASVRDDISTVAVNRLAAPAEAQSQSFASPLDPVQGASLEIQVGEQTFTVPIPDGSTLEDVSTRIQQSGAPVDVAIQNDGDRFNLVLTTSQTGFPVGSQPASALQVRQELSGANGQALDITTTREAVNARITVNGSTVESSDNVIKSAVPGISLELKNTGIGPESGVLASWKRGQENLANASNDVFRILQAQLLAGGMAVRVLGPSTEETEAVKAPSKVADIAEVRAVRESPSTDSDNHSARNRVVTASKAHGVAAAQESAAPEAGGIFANAGIETAGVVQARTVLGVRAYQAYLANAAARELST